MHTDDLLIECKTVLKGNKQITLRADYLKGLQRQADIEDRGVAVAVELDGKRWILQPETDWLERR